MSKTSTSSESLFTGRWWLDRFRIGFWVTVVSVLVWIYADMEFPQTAKVRITVHLTTGGAGNMVLLSRPTRMVTFKLRGSRNSLSRFEKKYDNTTQEYDLSRNYRPGRNQAVTSTDVLAEMPEMRDLGLSVVSAEPKTITGVHIDRLERHEVPVEFRHSGVELEKKPQAAVAMLVASSRWNEIIRKTQGQPTIPTVEMDLKHLTPGQTKTVEFELVPSIADVPVEPAQASISVEIEVRRRTITKTISIAVRILTPPGWVENGVWNEYQFKRKDRLEWLRQITIEGPREDLDKLDPKSVDAHVALVEGDKKPVSWTVRKVTLRFPPDLKIQLAPGQAPPTVQFRLEKRTASGP